MSQMTSDAGIPQWTLGWRLQRSLAHAGISVEKIADELGVSRSTVSRWMNDHGTPRSIYVKEWALRCGVPYHWLATGEELGPDSGPGLESPVTNRNTQVIDLTARLTTPPEQGQRAA